MRKKIVAGNWKMNKTWEEAKNLLLNINNYVSAHETCEVIVAPPAPYLDKATDIFQSKAKIAAQNVSEYEDGAYTGEISTGILKSINVEIAIIGHSERRSLFGETNEMIGKKVDRALNEGITPIICCGEVLEERKSGNQQKVVSEQLIAALAKVDTDGAKNIIIAYEPVWAIGTGETASPEQAQEMHKAIRDLLAEKYTQAIADEIRILYGGSVKPGNAEDLFSQPDIDGGLVGGASLNAEDFKAIISAGS